MVPQHHRFVRASLKGVAVLCVAVIASGSSGVLCAQGSDHASPPPSVERTNEAPTAKDANGFQQGSTTTPSVLQKSARARAVHEAVQLTADAALAFDRGDVERGRGLAKAAVQKLEAIEKDEDKRGNGRARSSFAMQRGKLLLEFLDDADGAEGAFADAVVSDGENLKAQQALARLLERKAARAKPVNSKGN